MRVAFREFQQRVVSLAARPPGWRFHLLLVLPALAVLYAFSFPGIHVVMAVFATYALAAAVVVWLLRLVGYLVLRSRGGAIGKGRWFTIAPLGGAVVGVLLWAGAPLRGRWLASRGAFEKLAAQVVQDKTPTDVPDAVDRRVGLYRVTSAWRVKEGVIFYDSVGSLIDDAGFAYLPDGPSADLESGSFENPQFRSLGRGWYAWTASW